jgi:hypothetical protein
MKNFTTNKAKLRILAMAILAAGAAGALFAELKAGYYTSKDSGSIQQTLPTPADTSSTYEAGSYVLQAPDLAEGEGLNEVYANCMTCHSVRYITMQPPLPAAAWVTEVTKMNKVYGAGISDGDAQKIIHYLQAHYTPETRKK